jgi:hypothetical protein
LDLSSNQVYEALVEAGVIYIYHAKASIIGLPDSGGALALEGPAQKRRLVRSTSPFMRDTHEVGVLGTGGRPAAPIHACGAASLPLSL